MSEAVRFIFRKTVLDGIFAIKRKIGPNTFVVEDLVDKSRPINLVQPLHAERMVKLDMPELERRADQPKKLEMREKETRPWNTYKIERFGVNGRVLLRYPGGAATWVESAGG